MWFVGTRLGSVDIEGLSATTTEDLVVDAPLTVSMPGMFVMWALASAVVVTVLALADWVAEVRGPAGLGPHRVVARRRASWAS